MFISELVSLLATILTVYLLCKHEKPSTLIASLVLNQVKEVGAEVTQKEINSECRTFAYTGITLTILSLVMVTFLHYRKSNFGIHRNNFDNIKFSHGYILALQKIKNL